MENLLFAKKTALAFAFSTAVMSNTALPPATTVGGNGLSSMVNPAAASVAAQPVPEPLEREGVLTQFLNKYESPLASQAWVFIQVADKYGLDWRLLPSIAGMESTFGKFLIEQTHNPFGWGGGYIYFNSYDEAIETVGRELARRFAGNTKPEIIGPTYTPPNFRNWIKGVNYFMNELDQTKPLPRPLSFHPHTTN